MTRWRAGAISRDEKFIVFSASSAPTQQVDELPETCDASSAWTNWERYAPSMDRSYDEFWGRHLQEHLGPAPDKYILFAQGGSFSASAEQIRKHPKSFYEKLLKLVSQRENLEALYYLEQSWGYIFGHLNSASQCAKIPELKMMMRKKVRYMQVG